MSPSSPPRWDGPATLVGGLLWLLSYGVDLAVGMRTGKLPSDPSASPLDWLGATSFVGATLALGVGLVGLRVRLQGRARKTGLAGLVFASLTLGAALVNLVLLSGLLGGVRLIPPLGAVGVLSSCIGVTLLGIATVRARSLPRPGCLVLPWVGLLHVALLFASNIPIEGVPRYVMENTPFALIGAVWSVLGLERMRTRAPSATLSSPLS
ncbi:hypothetical protein [Archangium lipolyticum]|uniref:hypothetical protein n=1 Tax=Archangium lipolyticum TaxID=2970465 RepID=UPI002149A41C|nr:hypothetical protein [Archangium lipolyticum]